MSKFLGISRSSDSSVNRDTTVDTAANVSDSAAVPRNLTGHSVGATVTVKGVARHKRKEISNNQLRREEIKKVVATAQDPLRALPTLPGVSAASDLSVRPIVRGGDLTETGVQLDGVPLLMPYHFGSAFSVFHKEALEDFQMYTGVAPAQSEGALSGTVVARTRPAPTDSFFGGVDVSLLRGSAWTGIPLVKDRVGLWLSAQSLWYDWTLKRLMDFGVLMGVANGDAVDQYKAQITLPTTWDAQAGLSWKIDKSWMMDVGGFAGGDKYQVLDQPEACYIDGKEIPCWNIVSTYNSSTGEYSESCLNPGTGRLAPCPPSLKKTTRIDTQANVGLSNWMARARLAWNPDKDLSLEGVVALQSVDWDVAFPGGRELRYEPTTGDYKVVRYNDSTTFDWTRAVQDVNVSGRKRWNEAHETSLGLGWGRGTENVNTNLSRPLANLILGTTGNPLEFLGLYTEKETVILAGGKESDVTFDGLAETDFLYDTSSTQQRPWAWIEHKWDPDPETRVRAGIRLSRSADGAFEIPNPRLQVQRQVTEKDLIGIGVALHTQSELPFEWRYAASTPLVSEKAWMGIVEWEHTFSPGWRTTISGWGKLYRDLASPSIEKYAEADPQAVGTGIMDWMRNNRREYFDSLQLWYYDEQSRYSQPGISDERRNFLEDSIRSVLLQAEAAGVPDSIKNRIADDLRPKRLEYASTGEGWAAGIEGSLRYQPTEGWTGWASAEWSISRRKDRDGSAWYPFGLERPWKLSWVNAFRIDKKWEISLRYSAMGGNPYTPFKIWDSPYGGTSKWNADTLLWIGKRNSGTLAPYQRLDMRVSRESKVFGKPATFYYEIWNAFNDPNMILRDNETGEFRTVQLNIPFPTIFTGMEVRF